MTAATRVCCSMISEIQTRYGSRSLRQGRSRAFSPYQASNRERNSCRGKFSRNVAGREDMTEPAFYRNPRSIHGEPSTVRRQCLVGGQPPVLGALAGQNPALTSPFRSRNNSGIWHWLCLRENFHARSLRGAPWTTTARQKAHRRGSARQSTTPPRV